MRSLQHQHPVAPAWAAIVARWIVGAVIVAAAVAGWRAASRWLGGDSSRALRSADGYVAPPVAPGVAGELATVVETDRPIPGAVLDVPTKPARSGARWTAEDDAYVTGHNDESSDAIAHHLGRTPNAVHQRRAVLRQQRLRLEGRG